MICTTNPTDQKSKCLLICLSGVSACEKPGLEEKREQGQACIIALLKSFKVSSPSKIENH
jgi:hypothetical protein